MTTNFERAFAGRPEVFATAARCFFAKTLDALGVRPDTSYLELEPELRHALVVGRPIADA